MLIYAELCSPNFNGIFSITSAILFSILVPFLLKLIKNIPKNWIRYILLSLIFLVYFFTISTAVIHISYYFINQMKIDEHSFLAIFQSDPSEMIAFISENSSALQLIIVSLIIIGFILLILKHYSVQNANQEGFTIKQLSLLVSGVLLFLLIPRYGLASTSFAFDKFNLYQSELVKFRNLNQSYNEGKKEIKASKQNSNETYIIVIGESLGREHMSLYGYHRKTTPNLDSLQENNELLVFNNVISNHTHTTPTLSYALTSANQYNEETFKDRISIINLLKAAGFNTAWVSNQVRYGIWDNHVGVIADNADQKIYFNKYVGKTFKNRNNDEIVLDAVQDLLNDSSSGNNIIFVHLIGNHFPYSEKFTKPFEKFSGNLSIGEFGKTGIPKSKRINAYDNSVLYNDHIINQLIHLLQDSEKDVKGLVYLPDHGEEVWERKSHQSNLFTYSMVESPLIIWLSEKYKNRYPIVNQNLENSLDSYWTNDLFYNLLVGLSGIKTTEKEDQLSLTNKSYKLPVTDIKTLHGKINYVDNSNDDYHIKENVKWLKENQLLKRILPHRVNTLGKLNFVKKYGFYSYEIDVFLKTVKGKQSLVVGHDNKSLTDKSLDDFLIEFSNGIDNKIWIDVKNLQASNIDLMNSHLEELQDNYRISKNVIIESKIRDQSFSILSDNKFHTSYYLPTSLWKEENEIKLKNSARQIAKQIKLQKVKAISFDKRVYSFVKKHLEPLIDHRIVYHTWDLRLNIEDPKFIKELKNKVFFKDKRVQTILFSFTTKYDY